LINLAGSGSHIILNQIRYSLYRVSVLQGKKFEFGVEIPKTPRAAASLDLLNANKLWESATQKELDQVIHEFSSFRTLADKEATPTGYKFVPYHIIYACKVDG